MIRGVVNVCGPANVNVNDALMMVHSSSTQHKVSLGDLRIRNRDTEDAQYPDRS